MNQKMQQSFGDVRIRGVLGRLEAVLDDENARLGKDPSLDLSHTNSLKSRCLYEITLLLRDPSSVGLDEESTEQLEKVREKLRFNAIKVKAHMDAVREVTDMLKEAAAAAEADGTYSADQFRSGAPS